MKFAYIGMLTGVESKSSVKKVQKGFLCIVEQTTRKEVENYKRKMKMNGSFSFLNIN